MQPKTIESYSYGVRRAAAHFNYRIDDLNKDQLTDYFAQGEIGVRLDLIFIVLVTIEPDPFIRFYHTLSMHKPNDYVLIQNSPPQPHMPQCVRHDLALLLHRAPYLQRTWGYHKLVQ
jgi:hypothetical protein